MKVKRLLVAVGLACTSLAHAAGIYAGIWQSGTDYLFVNHSGNGLIVTTLSNVPVSNVVTQLPNGQFFYPSTLDLGDLVSGELVGTSGTLTGTGVYRVCNLQIFVNFTSPTTMQSQMVASWPTPIASAQGINCEGIRQASNARTGLTRAWARVF